MAVVTVSREVGSYGDEIAALVAQKLGYELVGHEQIQNLAQSCDADFQKACAAFDREVMPSSFWERLFFGNPAYTALFQSLTFDLASRGNVVLVGRGSQFALTGIPGVLKVRIVAPKDLRIKRIQRKKGVSVEEALAVVERYGAQRRALIDTVYHQETTDWSRYDLILNTAVFGPEDGADVVCEAARKIASFDREDRRRTLANLAFAKRIESAIKKQIATSDYRDVLAKVEAGGKVTLEGFVQDKPGKEKAKEIARGVEGVSEVVNNIRTTELSF